MGAAALAGFLALPRLERHSAASGIPSPQPSRAPLPVRIRSEPPGARVVLVPLDRWTGLPRPERAIRPPGRTPLTVAALPIGEYLVVAEVAGHGFHEVYRTVDPDIRVEDYRGRSLCRPGADGVYDMPTIGVPTADVSRGMVRFDGGAFVAGSPRLIDAPSHPVRIEPFYLDTHEVTIEEFRSQIRGMLPRVFTVRMPPGNYPMTWVAFDRALEYAERVGKRLPDELEYEYAATNGGQTEYPWGNDPAPPWNRDARRWFGLEAIGTFEHDRTPTSPPVMGLYSNALEWTTSGYALYPGTPASAVLDAASYWTHAHCGDLRVVRGGPEWFLYGDRRSDPLGPGPRARYFQSRRDGAPGLGFRCARSVRPRFLEP